MAKQRKRDDAIAVNRRARHEYRIDDTLEAGLVLTGTEVKSLRDGKASLQHAYAVVRRGEVWLYGCHIPEYAFGNRANHEPTRPRKLLLHREEIARLEDFTREAGRTLVPLRLYWRDGRAKLALGLAGGKTQHDKRKDIAERDAKRTMERELADRRKGR
ncbi:MAG: SsrA-binding protein SmpB [Actinomycetota bacterium]